MESTNSPKCMKIEHSHTFAYIFHSRIAIICNNYLYYCYDYGYRNETNITKCLDYLEKLDCRSHYMFYRIAGFFFKYMFEGNKMKAKQIKDQLIMWGYGNRVISWKI
ncbi:hypothetical protein B5E95_10185 [Lactobacillus gallinarum]|nr:hypothetical protein B5E95_10185 [Lactobacillus gallinarum]OUQ45952.1 hypothetical protein B5E63_08770 [Lactobacillus gallinarum]